MSNIGNPDPESISYRVQIKPISGLGIGFVNCGSFSQRFISAMKHIYGPVC